VFKPARVPEGVEQACRQTSLPGIEMNGKVISLNIGKPRQVTYRGVSFSTGIFKEPIDKPLTLKKLNFTGDGQADLSAHGGIDKAVYCYPSEHYGYWQGQLSRKFLPWGQFGENVTTEGLLEDELRIGDILRMGTAVVQISEPRIPCYKLIMRMDAGRDFSVRFLAANRTGFYCRVLEEGSVEQSDSIRLQSRDLSSPTVRDVIAATQFADRKPVELRKVVRARGISAKWRSRVRRMIDSEMRRQAETDSPATRSLRVEKIHCETKDVISIWLRPNDGAPLFNALPGQYLTVVWPDGLKRTYSLSALQTPHRCRITVKLVRDAEGVLSATSARIAKLEAGDALDIERPRGNFHPDLDDDTPLVLAGAGIGVTPIMSMIERATRSGRRDVFAAFGMRRPGEHPLASELRDLLAERHRFQITLAYSQLNGAPLVEGLPTPKHGRLAASDLLPLAAAPLAEIFLCGPGEFIRQMHDGLVEAGVSPLNIRHESFGPSTLLPVRGALSADPAMSFTVSFARSRMETVWSPSSGTLLNLAEAAGVSPAFGCRAGSCGLCRTAISEGSVSYIEPIDEPDAGYVLPCCAIPQTDCRLDL
jgi:MOSC domain-containing protein YiiM/ferredoxin-NADP reductase